jgi:hypothetical protein
MKKALVAGLVGVLALAGCGGGGGGGTGAGASTSLQGFWVSEGGDDRLVVTPNNEFWGFIGSDASVLAAYKGTAAVSGDSFDGQGNFYFAGFPMPMAINAQFTQGGSITGTTSSPEVPDSEEEYALTYKQGFDQAPPAIQGAFTLHSAFSFGMQPGSFSIDAAGAISGANDGCSFSGNISPDASGKNFYRVSLTFADSPDCALPGQTASGIGLYDASTDSGRIMVTSSNDNAAFVAGFMRQ